MSINQFNSNISDVSPPPRIVGGYEVQPAFKYPPMVSLYYRGQHWCGGSLINSNTIITAAHCNRGQNDQWQVKVHRHNLTKSDAEENGKTYNVIKRTIHPDYDLFRVRNDIAIWKIDAPSSSEKLLELDEGSLGEDNSSLLTTIGWGRLQFQGVLSDILMEVKLPIFDPPQCTQNYAKVNLKVNNTLQICAGYPEGKKDSCNGDSGGPLFKVIGSKFYLVGLVSFGKDCALPEFPGVYTRISAYKDWILSNLN
ncbi:trypsin-like serine protease [Conidiobolus coronatus NRRL 28638]|uniref:Trypsin-like serine protease n=1 Tax=Conidiobolus coronatus (strain ATCC 28846 / CBS 209.66 / NRRL 28638) TaxID=796925 RepID=A0A137NW63_CONC2|nr:trypsin-like serine protease [Conidiobolus coronatus NRRL 28638]|eukprot:KXN67075.1 trypsin-like serine protease [Conidiobolus coronatus NRRL 28638]